MDKKSKICTAIIVLSVVVIGFTSAQTLANMHTLASLRSVVHGLNREVDKSKKAYAVKKEKITNQAMSKALQSSDPSLNTVARQNNNYAKVTDISNKFFETYYTWNNSDEYHNRANKLGNLITPEIKTDKKVFDEGKDSTGKDLIKGSGLQSKFDSAKAYLSQSDSSTVNALVKVKNESWFKGNQDQSGNQTHYYELTYDLKTNKISALKLVLTVKNDSEDTDAAEE